ncbi:hypothetical protein BGZ97_011091, partial [Linnemannia gamsii]
VPELTIDGDHKDKEAAPSSAVASSPVTIVGPGEHVRSAAPDSNAVSVSLGLRSPEHAFQIPSTTPTAPVAQMQPSPATNEPLRVDIFPEN